MTTVAISSIIALGLASIFNFGITQMQLLMEQNAAEENLLMTSFYLRKYLTQAVKIECKRRGGYAPGNDINDFEPIFLTQANAFTADLLTDTAPPVAVPRGSMNCMQARGEPDAVWDHFPAGTVNLFAAFFRETAGMAAAATAAVSVYRDMAIYFLTPGPDNTAECPTCAPGSGAIYFVLGDGTGANLVYNQNSVSFDRLVGITVTRKLDDNNNIVPNVMDEPLNTTSGIIKPLRMAEVRVTARYFKSLNGNRSYARGADNGINGNAPYRDISLVVGIGFRNNWLGTGGTNISQRLYGGLYFYDYKTPNLADINF